MFGVVVAPLNSSLLLFCQNKHLFCHVFFPKTLGFCLTEISWLPTIQGVTFFDAKKKEMEQKIYCAMAYRVTRGTGSLTSLTGCFPIEHIQLEEWYIIQTLFSFTGQAVWSVQLGWPLFQGCPVDLMKHHGWFTWKNPKSPWKSGDPESVGKSSIFFPLNFGVGTWKPGCSMESTGRGGKEERGRRGVFTWKSRYLFWRVVCLPQQCST